MSDKLQPKSTVKEWAKSVWLNIHRLLRDF